jgi:hypothetical protein
MKYILKLYHSLTTSEHQFSEFRTALYFIGGQSTREEFIYPHLKALPGVKPLFTAKQAPARREVSGVRLILTPRNTVHAAKNRPANKKPRPKEEGRGTRNKYCFILFSTLLQQS